MGATARAYHSVPNIECPALTSTYFGSTAASNWLIVLTPSLVLTAPFYDRTGGDHQTRARTARV